MAKPCLKCFRRKNGRLLTIIPQRNFREFFDDMNTVSQKKITSAEVNKRLFENEYFCFPRNKRLGFSANQMDVNRPVEDRWSASRIGAAMSFDSSFCDITHPLSPFTKEFLGGSIFTVADGHAGHTCAHAMNLLHPDYFAAALMPTSIIHSVIQRLNLKDEANTPHLSSKLSQPFMLDDSAVMTSETSEHTPSNNPAGNWRQWGSWGPLDSKVSMRQHANIQKFLTNRLSAQSSAYGDCVLRADGNIFDPEGYLISEGTDFPAIIRPDSSTSTTLGQVATVASAIRSALENLDSNILSDGAPDSNGSINKSLLRIVLSGCVATSVYLPDDQDIVYIAQVGDCEAVLGSYTGSLNASSYLHTSTSDETSSTFFPHAFNPALWKADCLVQPHNAQNMSEIERLQSQHPIHESNLLIAEDRLLGELMPLRAFGDIRYKLPAKVLKKVANLLGMPPNYPVCPRFYHSPPYLIATPQIVCKKIDRTKDRFIILATDGLWDMLSHEEAVNVVGQHYIDYKGDPSHAGVRDTAASRLVRTALGGPNMDTSRIAMHLSVPANVARFYRDDITVLVIYP